MSADSGKPEDEAFARITPRRPSLSGEPTSAAGGARPEQTGHSSEGISGQTLGVMLGLALILAVLLFWLASSKPDSSEPQPSQASETPGPRTQPTEKEAPAENEKSEKVSAADLLSDTDALEARAAAQSARANYESRLSQLMKANADFWASGTLASAAERAEAGAKAFEERDFKSAQQHYEYAKNLTDRLIAEIPERLGQALNKGFANLEGGNKNEAREQFELALKLDPGNERAQHGLERVAVFDEVRAKLQTARRLEQIGDLAGARNSYQQALELDPDTRPAIEALAWLAAEAKKTEFNLAMGEAISALDRGAYDTAELRLNRAKKIDPNSAAVATARARLAEARRIQALNRLQSEAAARVAEENWAGAIQTYRKAQKIDPNIGFAAEGLAIAEPRARLAADLKDFAERPERLAAKNVADQAKNALAWARSRDPIGPRLAAQIQAVEIAVAEAAKPVDVILTSDGQTSVQIYKLKKFGSFTQERLRLQPGRYVAVGSRPGYRDIRKDLDIPPGGGTLTIDIRCTEPL